MAISNSKYNFFELEVNCGDGECLPWHTEGTYRTVTKAGGELAVELSVLFKAPFNLENRVIRTGFLAEDKMTEMFGCVWYNKA